MLNGACNQPPDLYASTYTGRALHIQLYSSKMALRKIMDV